MVIFEIYLKSLIVGFLYVLFVVYITMLMDD